MCGIAACLLLANSQQPQRPGLRQSEILHSCALLSESIARRGPDHHAQVYTLPSTDVDVASSPVCLCLAASVLNMRGQLTPQPFPTAMQTLASSHQLTSEIEQETKEKGKTSESSAQGIWTSVSSTEPEVSALHDLQLSDACSPLTLLFNGEIYMGLKGLEAAVNDTQLLHAALHEAIQLDASQSEHEREQRILDVLQRLRGPWAIILYDSINNELWFGRDFFGRRSLIIGFDASSPENRRIILTSVLSSTLRPQASFWFEVPAVGVYRLKLDSVPAVFEQSSIGHGAEEHVASPPAKIGLQCYPWAVLAAESIELPHNIAERLTPLNAFFDIHTVAPLADEKHTSALTSPISLLNMELTVSVGGSLPDAAACACGGVHHVDDFLARLRKAVDLRSAAFQTVDHGHTCVGVLFSGGIDCMVIATLLDEILPLHVSIDLINVAFENTRRKAAHVDDIFSVPDRQTGIHSYEELCALSATKHTQPRTIRLVKVNILQQELESYRQHVRQLVDPLDTILDDSIGCAIWFAARGKGVLHPPASSAGLQSSLQPETYSSPARILLLGMGADEQLGGYGRHRSAWDKRGWNGALEEVHCDITRISSRNLGRDDRVVSDHGKEGRYPFLDEDLVCFLNSLPLQCKMDFTLPRGQGEKQLLRLAAGRLGIQRAAAFPKRAIQFGSRIAKMYDSNNTASAKFDQTSE
eukprot:m.69350 g.69350  ORF g.69350 m.69350 type:complete len:698 (+) comp13731_c0_seq1:96-2189(+)